VSVDARRDRAEVLLLAGSPSDLDLVLTCEAALGELDITSQIRVLSAHRTPDLCADLARDAEKQGFSLIITFAGLAAHLGGVATAHTRLPVIQVPVASGPLTGIDAALASLQMPPGAPLAVVGIDAARNAALLAGRMLALVRPELRDALTRADEKARLRYAPETIEREIAERRAKRRS
jgi:5-(carboxyamino)imidazole ribonucleotide mutase